MSDLRIAAQQALEALEDYERHTGFRSTATDALRAALAQQEQEQAEPVAWIQPDHLQKARQAPFLCRVEPTKRMSDFVPIFTHPPRRDVEQEPAARVLQTVGQYHTGRFVAEVETVRRLRDGENLYTAPPRREWVSLTDEEIVKIVVECHRGSPSEFYLARDIEQALKEKNHE